LEEGKLKREITVLHGVLLLVGTVIGASSFILIGPLAAKTGPSLWMAYALAAIPAIFVAVVFAQLGTAFPMTGATYISVSRLLSPAVSLIMAWSVLLGISLFVLPLMGLGVGIYVKAMLPPMSSGIMAELFVPLVALISLVFFTWLNVIGVKWMMWFQSIATGLAIIVLMVFGLGGIFFTNPSYQTPMFPLGIGALTAAIIPAYIMYTGVNAMTEMGGETKNPRRSIPLILLISMILLIIIYVSITYSLTGLMPWQECKTDAVAVAAGKFLTPTFGKYFAGIGAILAAVTTILGGYAFLSRDVMALGKDLVLPGAFGRVNRRYGTPANSIILLGATSVVGLFIALAYVLITGSEDLIVQLATSASLAFMLMSVLGCICMFLLPRKMPERYEAATFKLKGFWLPFFTIGGAVLFSGLIVVGFVTSPIAGAAIVVLVITGIIYFYLRRWQLRRRGVQLEDRLSRVEEA
jgi:APA family basic amino acid/polyamine antiporter